MFVSEEKEKFLLLFAKKYYCLYKKYCLNKKSCPLLYSKLPYKSGQDFLDIQQVLNIYKKTANKMKKPLGVFTLNLIFHTSSLNFVTFFNFSHVDLVDIAFFYIHSKILKRDKR